MINYDESVKTNQNRNWSYFPDHLYRIFIVGGLGLGKSNALLNLIQNQGPDVTNLFYISKMHLNQSISYLLIEEKSYELNIKTIQRQLLIIH